MTEADLELRLGEFQRAIEARDVQAAQEVLDEDYALVLVHPTRAVITRDMWLSALPDYVVSEWTLQEQLIDVDGDCAAVLQKGFQRAVVQGQSRDGVFLVSDIWRRRQGQWRVWRRHSSPLSAGEIPIS